MPMIIYMPLFRSSENRGHIPVPQQRETVHQDTNP